MLLGPFFFACFVCSGVNFYDSCSVVAGDDASLIKKLLDNAKLRVD